MDHTGPDDGTVDMIDSKSIARKGVGVQIPLRAPMLPSSIGEDMWFSSTKAEFDSLWERQDKRV